MANDNDFRPPYDEKEEEEEEEEEEEGSSSLLHFSPCFPGYGFFRSARATHRPRFSFLHPKSMGQERERENSADSPINQRSGENPVNSSIDQRSIENPVDSSVKQRTIENSVDSSVKQRSIESSVDSSIKQRSIENPVDSSVKQRTVEYSVDSSVKQRSKENSVDPSVNQRGSYGNGYGHGLDTPSRSPCRLIPSHEDERPRGGCCSPLALLSERRRNIDNHSSAQFRLKWPHKASYGHGYGLETPPRSPFSLTAVAGDENFCRLLAYKWCRRFSLHELIAATDNFSAKNIVGKGSSGTVFQAKLANGKRVAIKSLYTKLPDGATFLNEIDIMATLKNRHIVALIGYAMEPHSLFLIYSFLPKGSLDKHLDEDSKHVLSWSVRYKIAVGVAKALHYLHHTCQRPIIHRDVKTSNILLSASNNPKLSDFGLAMRSPQPFLLSNDIAGTFGYLAPEYFHFGKISEKTDVFSYGVVLLELITGRKPIDASKGSGEENLVEWARPLLLRSECMEKLVDPRLRGFYCAKTMKRTMWMAALCLHSVDTCRPYMSQVLHVLQNYHGSKIESLLKHSYPSLSLSLMTLDYKLPLDKKKDAEMRRYLATAMADTEDEEGSLSLLS